MDFLSGFFKSAWHIIGSDVCYAVKDFFCSSKMLKCINATLISLVPKVVCPKTVSDYRPIACCNIIYKAITARMQGVMAALVDEVQGVFIKGRSIIDNVLVCQGFVQGYHKPQGTPRCLLKLDLRKAYDMLDWGFIEAMLKGLNFPVKFINWIMVCITTPKFSLLLNGSPCSFFSSKRGVRQGDPMSPYLFVLGVKYLTRLLKDVHRNPKFRFHPKCNELNLAHLAFADDMMFVCYADKTSPILLKEGFDSFSKVSGLCVNVQKSQAFFAAIDGNTKQYLLNRLGFMEEKFPVKYLGVPLISAKLTQDDCAPIIDKVRRSLVLWRAKQLTYAGRV